MITRVKDIVFDGVTDPIDALDMGGNTINNVGTPSDPGDAASKDYVDTEITNVIGTQFVLKAGDTMTGDLLMSGNRIQGLALAPSISTEATSKDYVDTELASAIPNVFTSSLFAATLSTLRTVAHGLGGKPEIVQLLVRNITPENGFSAGEDVILNPGQNELDEGSPAGTQGWNLVSVDATNIYFALSDDGLYMSSKSSPGQRVSATIGNWNVFVRAVRF